MIGGVLKRLLSISQLNNLLQSCSTFVGTLVEQQQDVVNLILIFQTIV